MVIGLLTVELYLPAVHSLKSKRQIIKSIVARVRNKFNVSISETGNNEIWQRASLSCCIVTNDSHFASQVLEKVMAHIEGNLDGEILEYKTSML
jgi:uncharacterized protein